MSQNGTGPLTMGKAKKNAYPPLHLLIEQEGEETRENVFAHAFRIGRDADCDLIIQHSHISRHHLEIDFKDQCWWVHDLESTNGVYVNGKKVMHAPVLDKDELVLGQDGPRLICSYISEAQASAIREVEAQKEVHKKEGLSGEKKRVVGYVVAVILLGVVGFFFGKNELGQQERRKGEALSLFADIRSASVSIADVHAEEEDDRLAKVQKIIELQKQRNEDLEKFRGHLIRLGVYGELDDKVTRQIYSASSLFSENELTLPASFVEEVSESIRQYWLTEEVQTMQAALERANVLKYDSFILKTLQEFGLPQEFFYLPMTISGFDSGKDLLSGFESKAGIWKLSLFSSDSYGLAIPDASSGNVASALDERYEISNSTRAAVSQLHDIYRKEAYASGLLTLALFLQYQQNHVDGKEVEVGTLLADVPDDMESRNLWYIRDRYPYRISDEVYEEVIRVFSAAVIGQDPLVFDLDFSTPTATNMSSNINQAFR